ncbi:single-stranded DNA-binding protein [Methylococcus sp. ANG]|uniref:single-stranded DNA-binding protein n=1 Tax=Methylococcus sp. ANG TaxID=3231903 RepID=UPI00345901CE
MTIYVLAQGELHRDPIQRTSQTGRVFTTANLKVQSDGETVWASIICFTDEGQQELLRLRAGDAVSVQGKCKLTVYQKGDEYRASLDVVANSVIALKPKPRPRQPRQARTDGREFDARQAYGRAAPAHQADDMPFDDEIPFA